MLPKMLKLIPEFYQGAGAVLISEALGLAKKVPGFVWEQFLEQCTVTVQIDSNSDSFQWLETWLAKHPYTKKARTLQVSNKLGKYVSLWDEDTPDTRTEEEKRPPIIFVPAVGSHFLKYKGTWMHLSRDKREVSSSEYGRVVKRSMESFTLRVPGRHQEVVRELLEEARDLALPPNDPRFSLWTPDISHWTRRTRKELRNPDSVILAENILEDLFEDVQNFFDRKQWYVERGLPYRRGILFFGPPGNGKTSIIHALASHFMRDIYVLRLGGAMTDGALAALASSVPEKSFLVIEDIDAAFEDRDNRDAMKVTFSGLLNALDGLVSGSGRVLIMTTNFKDRLDEALVRPGRVDREIEIQNANQGQARKIFLRFFPEEQKLAEKFAEVLPDNTKMAKLQEILVTNQNDPEAAISTLQEITND